MMNRVHTVTAAELSALLPPRDRNTHKGDYGYIAILGGCMEYSGAPRLANLAQSALRVGCGVAALAVPESLAPIVAPWLLESTLFRFPERDGHLRFDSGSLEALTHGRRALAFGMGGGRGEDMTRILDWLLSHFAGSLLIDADGLWALSEMGTDRLREASCPVVLTPHAGEFARLTGLPIHEVLSSGASAAQSLAQRTGAVVLLKGAVTAVTDGTETLLVDRGTPGMATAGSGDVLSGVLAGLLGYLPPDVRTVALGAYLCGLAGEFAARDVGEIPMLASDTAAHLPEAVRAVRAGLVP